jgi:acyl-CoA synthetase (AMP-forming)/AMP-acid ligase II
MSALDEASTVGGLLLRSARRWPDSPALVEGQTVLTHRQAASRARTVARRLAARGVRRGDRIALALPNGWRYAVTYLGVQLAGGTAVIKKQLAAQLAEQLAGTRSPSAPART